VNFNGILIYTNASPKQEMMCDQVVRIVPKIIQKKCIVFVILCYCVCNYYVVYCFECVCVILCFLCIVLYCVVYCSTTATGYIPTCS
jgi:hypothetical protein